MTKTIKKVFSVFLSVLLLVTAVPMNSFAMSEECACGNIYDDNGFCLNAECNGYQPAVGTTDRYDVNNDFVLDTVYEISNAGQLYWFAEQVNSGSNSINAVLIEDIVINENVVIDYKLNEDDTVVDDFRVWTSIGDTTYRYAGVFDGQNHTVSGIYIYSDNLYQEGLFGCTKGAVVKNVGVIDSYIYAASQSGGVVGLSFTSTINNCYFDGVITGDSPSSIGGVVGDLPSGTVENCYNLGKIDGDTRVGGVVGDSEGTINSCYNLGVVIGTYMTGGVCGIVGYINEEALITNSYNAGDVYGNHTTGGVVGYSTGIVIYDYNEGYVSGGFCTGGVVGDSSGVATKCYNIGEINGSSTVGGVFGRAHDDIEDSYNTGNVTCKEGTIGGITGYISSSSMRNCYNTGTIKSTATAYSYFGGIVGEITGGSTLTTGEIVDEMVNCYNWGDVIGNDYTGGVAGWASLLEITNCYNEGNITSSMDVTGGVIGCSYSYNVIKNCYNEGTVTAVGYTTGGIVGIANAHSEIVECYNEGNITSESYNAGGVVGTLGKVATLENCYNIGNVMGSYYIGGIAGKNLGIIENAHNTANVCATSYYGAGGVAGINSGTITNCFYAENCATTNLYKTTIQNGVGNSKTTPLDDIEGATAVKTAEQFASGEVCFALNVGNGTTWKQTIGYEKYPMHYGEIVYYKESEDKYFNVDYSLLAISHQPTAEEPYVELYEDFGAKYQWYEIEKDLTEVTEDNAEKVSFYGGFESSYDSEIGWTAVMDDNLGPHEFSYFTVKLEAGDVVVVELSDDKANYVSLFNFETSEDIKEFITSGKTTYSLTVETAGEYRLYVTHKSNTVTVKASVGEINYNRIEDATDSSYVPTNAGIYACLVTYVDGSTELSKEFETPTPLFTGIKDNHFYKDDVMQKAYQLVEINGDFYFIGDRHEIVKNKTVYLNEERIKGLTYADGTPIQVGYYEFDANGKMVMREGIVGNHIYKNNTQLKAYQLVEVDGDFYYISDRHEFVKNKRVYLKEERINGLTYADGTPITAGYYDFDEDGKMVILNGIVGNKIYKNNTMLKAYQLVEIDGDFYLIGDRHEIVKNKTTYLNEARINGLTYADGTPIAVGNYDFDENGKMIILNGIVGNKIYKNNTMLKAYQLVEVDGDFYFIGDRHEIAKDRKIYLNEARINGLTFADGTPITVGYYNVDADGKMIIE